MVFKRKIYSKLKAWKEETQGRKALLVEGARRIGKSTIVEKFAKNEYQSYLLIDFSKNNAIVDDAFKNHLNDLDTFFMLLSTEFNKPLYPRKSILIFDEIQKCPLARQSIKALVKDGRFDYIETGSLISIRENVKDIVIPSEERKIKMYPLDFEEFCCALNSDMTVEYIKKCFKEEVPLEKGMHEKAMLLFKQYMIVGGMPQSVVAFLEGAKNFAASDKEKRDILSLYRDDIMKIEEKYQGKVLSIFDQIPAFLSQHEKRVVFGSVESGSYFSQYAETFFWLSNSMITNECYNCTDPSVAFKMNEDRTYIKCYLGDTGLLVSHSFSEKELSENEFYKQILNDKLSLNEGMFYENAIFQMLVAGGHEPFFYVHYNKEKHRNDMEIDFIISNGSKLNTKLFPIEVKSTSQYKYDSLKKFSAKYSSRIEQSYIIHPKNLVKKESGILAIPPYMTMCL